MKKMLISSLCVGLFAFSGLAMADAGDVGFVNNGQAVSSTDAVQFEIVTQDGRQTYTNQLSAQTGANSTTLHSGAIQPSGTTTTSFDVYIQDVATGSGYQKCLNAVSYNATWAPQYIFGWYSNGQFACALGSSAPKAK